MIITGFSNGNLQITREHFASVYNNPAYRYFIYDSSRISDTQGGLTDEVMQVQIRNTIEEHLEKEIELKDRDIKVLSLFFIDKVANYREYDEHGNAEPGKIARWFEQKYEKLIQMPRYKDVLPYPLSKIHDEYFAVDKQNRIKDSWEGRDVKDDEEAYNLIMKDKERLLSKEEPLQFIFSHSALREGWDNPNVFQICTLNESGSEIKKRQEIGCGLRILVNQEGERVFDERINRVTIVANESYDDFAAALQSEYEEIGIKFGIVPKTEFSGLTLNGEELGADISNEIWNHLIEQGFLNSDGAILSTFEPERENFILHLEEKYLSLEAEIIDAIRKFDFSRKIENKKQQRKLTLNKQVYLDEDFKVLWDKINKKTRYRVSYDSNLLIEKCVKEIAAISFKRQVSVFFLPHVPEKVKKPKDFRNLKPSEKTLSKKVLLTLRRATHLQQIANELKGESFWREKEYLFREIKDEKIELTNQIVLDRLRKELNISIEDQMKWKSGLMRTEIINTKSLYIYKINIFDLYNMCL